MARGDIRQKISLDGGEEVRRQLVLIGAAGEKALRDLERATLASSASLGRFTQLSTTLSTAFAATGQALAPVRAAFAGLGASTAAFGSAVGGMVPQLNGLKAVLLGFVGAGGAFAAFKAAKDSAFAVDDLADTAQNLGITTDQLQALRLMAAEEGSEVDRLSLALGKFNIATANAALASKDFKVETKGLPSVFRGMADESSHAAAGIGGLNNQLLTGVRVLRGSTAPLEAGADAFKILGINAVEFAKLDLFERLKLIEGPMNRLGSAALQNKVASDLFGRSWKDLLPLLSNGGKAFSDALAKVKELGIGLSDADKNASKAFLISFARLEASFDAAKNRIGSALGDALLPVFNELTRLISANMQGIRAWANEVGKAAVPVVRDLVTLIGNLGRTMREQEPLHTSFGRDLVSTFRALKEVFLGVADAFKTLSAAVDVVLIPINKMFGTELTGGVVLATALVLKFVGAFALLGGIVTLMTKLGVAIATVLAIPLWTVAAIAGLTALTAYLLIHTDAWKNFTGIVKNAGGILKSVGTIAARAASGDFAALKQAIADVGAPPPENRAEVEGWFTSLPGMAKLSALGVRAAFLPGTFLVEAAKLIDWEGIRSRFEALPGQAKQTAAGIKAAFSGASADTDKADVGGWFPQIDFAGIRSRLEALPALAKQAVDGMDAAFKSFGASGPPQIQTETQTFLTSLPGWAQTAWTAVGEAMTAGVEIIKAAWTIFKDWMAAQNQAFWDGVGAAATTVDQSIRQVWGDLSRWVTETLGGALAGIWKSFKEAADSALSSVAGLLDRLVSRITRIASSIAGLFGGVGDAGVDYGGGGGMATGGLVRGPGTGTSDSILARLSNREHVTRAKAVDYYGPGLFDLLNRMAIPRDQLRAAVKGMRGFSLGGFVTPRLTAGNVERQSRSLPRFADGGRVINTARAVWSWGPEVFAALNRLQLPRFELGGLVEGLSRPLVPQRRFAAGGLVAAAPSGGGKSRFTLMLDSQGPFDVSGPSNAVEQLERHARARKMLSAGRRPGHYGS